METHTTLLITCTVVDLHSAVNNIKVFSAEMEMQQWVIFALLSRYIIFCMVDVNNENVFTQIAQHFCPILNKYGAS